MFQLSSSDNYSLVFPLRAISSHALSNSADPT